MRRFGGWVTGRGSNDKIVFNNAAEEIDAVVDASTKAAWVMNDEIERAREELAKGETPFHKLGYGSCLFWQAVLGFDKEKMIGASAALADAEAIAAECKRAATSSKGSENLYRSKIYPDGAAYALIEAEAQLLGAILGILKESWLESVAGLNKLRKAYFCIQGLYEAERKYLKLHPVASKSTQGNAESGRPTSVAPASVISKDDAGSDDEFFDAEDDDNAVENTEKANAEDMDVPDLTNMHINGAMPPERASSIMSAARASVISTDELPDFHLVTSDPMEHFIHSGVGMCWGILQIVLGLLPPAFRYLLSMFKFRGDRDNGMRILWEVTNFRENIFGSIASLVVLLYNDIAVALADITPDDAYPEQRLRLLLSGLRELYPSSRLWLTEEARMLVNNRKLEDAVTKLSYEPPNNSFVQLYGLSVFEKGLDLMFLHRFEEAAETFVHCTEVNAWSHGMYFYIAAACHIELYRDLKVSNTTLAKIHANKAMEILTNNKVSILVRKKALLGQQLPFDGFITIKLDKWEAVAKAKHCDLIDAVGVSPIEEFCYFWTGYRRMNKEQLQISLDRLAANEAMAEMEEQTVDERAALAVLKGAALRAQGRLQEAKAIFKDEVFCHSASSIKSCTHATNYPLPVAHYELGVCLWQEAGGEHGDRELLRAAKDEIAIADKWDSWSLEDRMVVKLMNARETFSKLGL